MQRDRFGRKHVTLTPSMRRTLRQLDRHGSAVRHFRVPGRMAEWVWRINGELGPKGVSPVCKLFSVGYVAIDRDCATLTEKGRAAAQRLASTM